MNILYILIYHGLFRPLCGGQSRYWNMTDQLVKRGHRVIILEPQGFFDQGDKTLAHMHFYKEIRFLNRTLCTFRDLNPSFVREVASVIKEHKVDIVIVTHPSGIIAAKVASLLNRKMPAVIYDAHNVESDFIDETFALDPEYSKFERTLIPVYVKAMERVSSEYVADYVFTVSEKDKSVFARRFGIGADRIMTVPICAPLIEPADKTRRLEVRDRLGISSNEIVVVFHGYMMHPANKEAFELISKSIAPRFIDKHPDVLFLIGGTGAPKVEVRNLKSVGFIEDLSEFLSAADIAILPLRHGAGVKVKFFDYMSMGLPIVTTQKGAEGIGVRDGESALIVQEVDDEFILALEKLIGDVDMRDLLGRNAKKLAIEEYNWDRIGEKMCGFLSSISSS